MRTHFPFLFILLNFTGYFAFAQENYFSEGIKKLEIQDYQGAIHFFDLDIAKNPDSYYSYFNRGASKQKAGDLDGALNDLNIAINLGKNNIQEHTKHLKTSQLANDTSEIRMYKSMIESNQIQLAETYYNRGIVYTELKKPQEALNDYNQAILLYNEQAKFYYNRGLLRRKMLDNQGAVDDYSQAIKLDKEYEIAYKNRGLAYYFLGKYAQAIQDYDKALTLMPNDAEIYYNRGLAKIRHANRAGACVDWKTAQKMGYSKVNEVLTKYCK